MGGHVTHSFAVQQHGAAIAQAAHIVIATPSHTASFLELLVQATALPKLQRISLAHKLTNLFPRRTWNDHPLTLSRGSRFYGRSAGGTDLGPSEAPPLCLDSNRGAEGAGDNPCAYKKAVLLRFPRGLPGRR